MAVADSGARRGGRGSRTVASWLPLAGALVVALAPPAPAEEGAPAPPVRLDRLLELPRGMEYDLERRGGATRTEWRSRFKGAQAGVTRSKRELDVALAKLEKAAEGSDQWRFVPPGGDVAAENQDNLRLRMDVERKREELTHAEKQLRDLEVEANLASVPPDWRE